jgi:hypothetical protein
MGWEVRFEKGLFFKRLSPARGRGGYAPSLPLS